MLMSAIPTRKVVSILLVLIISATLFSCAQTQNNSGCTSPSELVEKFLKVQDERNDVEEFIRLLAPSGIRNFTDDQPDNIQSVVEQFFLNKPEYVTSTGEYTDGVEWVYEIVDEKRFSKKETSEFLKEYATGMNFFYVPDEVSFADVPYLEDDKGTEFSIVEYKSTMIWEGKAVAESYSEKYCTKIGGFWYIVDDFRAEKKA